MYVPSIGNLLSMVSWADGRGMLAISADGAFASILDSSVYCVEKIEWVEEQGVSPEDRNSRFKLIPVRKSHQWWKLGSQDTKDQDPDADCANRAGCANQMEDEGQRAWEIRTGPGEEIVVENGRVTVRKIKGGERVQESPRIEIPG